MKVGLIHNSLRFAHDGRCSERLDLVTFTISPDRLSYTEIFDSSFASPARYVMEVFRRLHHADMPDSGVFIFNPLFELPTDLIRTVCDLLGEITLLDEPLVVADVKKLPMGYYFPARIDLSDVHFFTLLSTVNAQLDQELLNVLFNGNSRFYLIDSSVVEYVGNHFLGNEELYCVYELLSRKSLALIKSTLPWTSSSIYPATKHLVLPLQKRATKFGFKFRAVMPHHAGDVLFFSLAAKYTPLSHISHLVVNCRYANIVSDLLPDYPKTTIDIVPPYRDGTGKLQSDESFFFDFAEELSPFSFHYYCRPSARGYNRTNFHLIDHVAFALGQSFQSFEELVTRIKGSPPVKRLANCSPARIVLHFDAGWGMKIYPKEYQQQLILELLKSGMEITILGTEDRDFGNYRSVTFKGLDSLKELLDAHHLLVGSDSFPSHYAAHVLGLPTICLFGPTKPVNSDALPSIAYKSLECGLTCCPCGNLEVCSQSGKSSCNNFVHPAQLINSINIMLKDVYTSY